MRGTIDDFSLSLGMCCRCWFFHSFNLNIRNFFLLSIARFFFFFLLTKFAASSSFPFFLFLHRLLHSGLRVFVFVEPNFIQALRVFVCQTEFDSTIGSNIFHVCFFFETSFLHFHSLSLYMHVSAMRQTKVCGVRTLNDDILLFRGARDLTMTYINM